MENIESEDDSEWPEVYDEDNEETHMSHQSVEEDFTFMTLKDIEMKFPDLLQDIMETLALSTDEAITALRYFHWNSEKLKEKWLDSEQELGIKIGITCDKTIETKSEEYCVICYSSF